MTLIRPYADLAPARYQLPVYILLLVLALALLLGTFHFTSAMAPPWLEVVRGACFATAGATLVVWPNGRIGNALAIRVIGALIVAVSLFSLVKFFLHHLV